jgi:formamidopyrimidine-DNA glycosylase
VPELPEVETYARDLAAVMQGRTFVGARCLWSRQVPLESPRSFAARIAGASVRAVSRRGKYLVFELDGRTLLVHLKMSGRLVLVPSSSPPDRHAHLVLELSGGDELRLRDPRKFARAYLLDDPTPVLGMLGPEPLDRRLTAREFSQRLALRSRRLKPLLLDQTFLAGLGNIYVDESLWLACLHPLRLASTLPPDDAARLHRAIRRVLRKAIAARGATLSDSSYRDLSGNMGEMQGSLAVYGRAGAPCRRCRRPLVRIVVGGRGTTLCSRCQPAPE